MQPSFKEEEEGAVGVSIKLLVQDLERGRGPIGNHESCKSFRQDTTSTKLEILAKKMTRFS
jgi:hypothetical protein